METIWTAEDVKQNAKNWNLEGDSQLLELIKSISENIIRKANLTLHNINGIGSKFEKSKISLENASNRLCALSRTQFVEHRVYEDDDFKDKETFDVQKETKIYDPNDSIKFILKNNLKMLQNCYYKVSVQLDDSDDEDYQPKKTQLYRPKDFFEQRLPTLIGSEKWNDRWHVGLLESDDESVSEPDNHPEQYSDNSEEKISLPSIFQTFSESGSSMWSINPNVFIKNSVVSEKPPTENKSKCTTSLTTKLKENSTTTTEQKYYIYRPKEYKCNEILASAEENFIFEKNSKIILNDRRNNSLEESDSETLSKISNIFLDEPPSLIESIKNSNNEMCKNSNGTVHHGSENDNDAESIFKNEKKTSDAEKITVMKKTVNLFDDNEFDSFMKELSNNNSKKVIQHQSLKKVNLFESDTDSDASCNNVKENPTLIAQFGDKKILKEHFIASSNNNEKSTVKGNKNKETVNEGSVSKDCTRPVCKSQSGDVDDLFGSNNIDNNKKPKNLGSVCKTENKLLHLFNDDPPEDDFDHLFQTLKHKETKTQKNCNTDSENEFDKEAKDIKSPNFSIKKIAESRKFETADLCDIKGPKIDLFSNDWSDDDEDLFDTTKVSNSNKYLKQDNQLNFQKNQIKSKKVAENEKKINKIQNFQNICSTEQTTTIPNLNSKNNFFYDDNDISKLKEKSYSLLVENNSWKKSHSIYKTECKMKENLIENEHLKKTFQNEIIGKSIVINDKLNKQSENTILSQNLRNSQQKEEITKNSQNKGSFENLSAASALCSEIKDIFLKSEQQNLDIGIFNDFPPDDLNEEQNKTIDGNVDDVFQSSPEIKIDSENFLNYIINEEPPVDSYFCENFMESGNSVKFDNADEIHLAKNYSIEKKIKNVSLTENKLKPELKQSEMKIDTASDTDHDFKSEKLFCSINSHKILAKNKNSNLGVKDISKYPLHQSSVSKISNTLSINVTALLPSALIPKTNLNSDVIKSQNIIEIGNDSNETSEGKLIGLNKHRPKILVKRRPSTRKARHENYRKTNIINGAISYDENTISNINHEKKKAFDELNVKEEQEVLKKSEVLPNLLFNEKYIKKRDQNSGIEGYTSSNKKFEENLFGNDNEDPFKQDVYGIYPIQNELTGDHKLSNAKKIKKTNEPIDIEKNYEDDDLFSSPFAKVVKTQRSDSNIAIMNKIEIKDQAEAKIQNKYDKLKSSIHLDKNILFSSDEDDNLFLSKNIFSPQLETNTTLKNTDKHLNKTTEIKISNKNFREFLFDDFEESEDDIFGATKVTKENLDKETKKRMTEVQISSGAIQKQNNGGVFMKNQEYHNPLADLLN